MPFAAKAAAAILCTSCGLFDSGPGDLGDAPVVLISIDTLRADRVGAYGYPAARTPNLDRLASEGVLFENAYSHCPLTLPAHASLLTGQIPPRHGVRDNIGFTLGEGATTLTERLRQAGWRTGGAISAYVLRAQTGISRGFEFYDDAIEIAGSLAALGTLQRDGARTIDALTSWIAGLTAGERFFAFLHLYEPHTPYSPPPAYASGDPYDGEVAYADALVGRFIEDLRRRGLYERALIVVTADHGEGLNDHGEQEHGLFLYREAVRVPLIIRVPNGAAAGTRVDATVAHVDVGATILDLVGLDPADAEDGRSLAPVFSGTRLEPQPVFSETLYPRYHFGWSELFSVSDGSQRYVRAPRPEFFDLAADPGERNNLHASRAGSVARHEVWLSERLAGSAVAAPGDVDPDVRARLEALGYVGVGGTVSRGGPLADPKDKVAAFEGFRRGLALRREERREEAVAAFRAVLKDEPEMHDAWEMLGVTLAQLGQIAEGVEALSQALKIDPERVQTHLTLARYYARLGRATLAREHAQLAAERSPGEGFEVLAQLAMDAGRLAAADDYARKSVAADDGRTMSHFIIGVVARESGRCEDALVAFERADESRRLLRNSVLTDLHAHRGDCLARLGREREAERAFLQELEAIPYSRRGRVGLATLYRSQGRDADARAVLEGLVAASPKATADVYWTVVRTFAILGDAAAAHRWAARARELFPGDGRFQAS